METITELLWYLLAVLVLLLIYVFLIYKCVMYVFDNQPQSMRKYTPVLLPLVLTLANLLFQDEVQQKLKWAFNFTNPDMKHDKTFTGDAAHCHCCDKGFTAVSHTVGDEGGCTTECTRTTLVYARYAPYFTIVICTIALIVTWIAERAARVANDRRLAELRALEAGVKTALDSSSKQTEKPEVISNNQKSSV